MNSENHRAGQTIDALRALIVEDNPMDAELMVLRLQDEGFDVRWERVESASAYATALATVPDLVLSDWNLPRFSGSGALRLLHESGIDVPFVIVSGSVGEEVAVAAMREGADDYVLKDRLARLGPAVRLALNSKEQRDLGRAAQVALRQAATVFQSSAEGITLTDAGGRILTVNPAFCEITGYRAEEVVDRNARILRSGRHDKAFFENMWDALISTGSWRGEIWNRRKTGEIYPEWLTISAVTDENGETTHYVGTFSDISAIKQAQQAVEFLAHHDPLTRLPNRALFRDRLQQRLNRARSEGSGVAVVHLDLDRFKVINDSLGLPVGDEVLQQMATRIAGAIRARDTLGRLGGDDFGLVPNVEGDARNSAIIARKLLDLCAAPLRIADQDLVSTASIGISLFPGDGGDADTLLKNAERAMYEAKSQGRNTYQFFAPALNAGIHDRLMMEHALRGAAARGELRVHYQPQVALTDGSLNGVEALVRWQHPSLGLVPPGVFIPMAEEMGIIGEIGEWVLDEACRQLAAWQRTSLRVPTMAVNLSVQQLEQPGILGIVGQALERHQLNADRLELEITESMMMRQPEAILRVLRELNGLGVRLAMDDFGTGYSSLGYLTRIPLDVIKIDMSFVRDIGHAHADAIISSVIALGRVLGIEIVAEGIELGGQAEFLHREGCQTGQGFLYGKPLPAHELLTAWGKP